MDDFLFYNELVENVMVQFKPMDKMKKKTVLLCAIMLVFKTLISYT